MHGKYPSPTFCKHVLLLVFFNWLFQAIMPQPNQPFRFLVDMKYKLNGTFQKNLWVESLVMKSESMERYILQASQDNPGWNCYPCYHTYLVIFFLQVAYSGPDRSCMLRRLQADTEYSVTVGLTFSHTLYSTYLLSWE